MHFPGVVVIGVDISEEGTCSLAELRRLNFLKGNSLHLVHVVQRTGSWLGADSPWSLGEGLRLVEEVVIEKMKTALKDHIPPNHGGDVRYVCLFSEEPEEALCKHASIHRAGLIIVAARERRGLFQLSFSHHLAFHAPSDVLILRNKAGHLGNAHSHGRMSVTIAIRPGVGEDQMERLRNYSFLEEANIHILHVVGTFTEGSLPGLLPSLCPAPELKAVMERSFFLEMERLRAAILPQGFTGHWSVECRFSPHVKSDFCDRVRDLRADLVVLIPDRVKQFGGFIHYQLAHCGSDILLLRGEGGQQ